MYPLDLLHLVHGIGHAPLFKSHAYLDPGSGSFLLQLLIASLVGAGFLIKTFWQRIVSFFTGKPLDTPSADTPPTDQPPANNDDQHQP